MLYLSKFYHLLKKNAAVVLYDVDNLDELYYGPVNGIPSEYNSSIVVDFCTTDWGFQFYIKKGTAR